MTRNEGLYRQVARWHRVQEFRHIKGLGNARAARILAAMELGRRIACASAERQKNSSRAVILKVY